MKIAYLGGLLLSIIVILFLIMIVNLGFVVSLGIGIVAGVCFTIFMIARSRGEKTKDVAKEVVNQALNPDANSLTRLVEEQLLKLNHRLRRQRPSSIKVIETTENVIDALLEVVPLAISDAPQAEATFDLEKLATDYLPSLIDNFLKLSESDQNEQEQRLQDQLKELSDSISAAKASLDEGKLHEFEVSSAFLKAKTN